jgi:hypothetical protein
LSDEAKQKAIDNEREAIQESGFEWLPDDMQYKLDELLAIHKLKANGTPKVYYRLSYSQGDGAMFEGTFQWRGYEVAIKQAGMYYHSNSKHIYIETRYGNEAKQSVYDEFDELYTDMSRELERYGYDVIEDAESDESIVEILKANECEFYEDGSMV